MEHLLANKSSLNIDFVFKWCHLGVLLTGKRKVPVATLDHNIKMSGLIRDVGKNTRIFTACILLFLKGCKAFSQKSVLVKKQNEKKWAKISLLFYTAVVKEMQIWELLRPKGFLHFSLCAAVLLHLFSGLDTTKLRLCLRDPKICPAPQTNTDREQCFYCPLNWCVWTLHRHGQNRQLALLLLSGWPGFLIRAHSQSLDPQTWMSTSSLKVDHGSASWTRNNLGHITLPFLCDFSHP